MLKFQAFLSFRTATLDLVFKICPIGSPEGTKPLLVSKCKCLSHRITSNDPFGAISFVEGHWIRSWTGIGEIMLFKNSQLFWGANKLNGIHRLLLDFFELIFHLNYQALNGGIIRFGANGINFSANFLSNEIQFFALTNISIQGL